LGIRLGNIAKEIYLMQGGNRKNMEFELEFETLCRDLEDEVSKFCEIDDLARILTGTMISILRKIIKYSDDPSESLDRILRALSKKED
jgi:hypothetical protein